METKNFLITDGGGCRVDVFLSNQFDFTRSRIKKLCDEQCVFVNGNVVKANKFLKENDYHPDAEVWIEKEEE